MSAARFFQLISGNGQKRSLDENEEATYEFERAPKDIKWEILKTLWKRGQIREVLAICASKNKEIRRFCKTYTHPARGGVLGALLEWTNPDLRKKHFPYLSYLVLKFPEQPWHFFYLNNNPSITWEVVLANPNQKWSFRALGENPHFTWQIVKTEYQLRYGFSRNPNITWDIVQANPSFAWDYEAISQQPNITWNHILMMEKSDASANPNITWDIVQSNPKYPWKRYELSKHKNITWQIIKDNPEFGWDWKGVTINPNITWQIIVDNPTYPWQPFYFQRNPNITPNIVTENNLPWGLGFFTNPNMTLEWALAHADELYQKYTKGAEVPWMKQVDRDGMLLIPTLTWNEIRQNMSLFKDASWSQLSQKQDINL